MKFARRATVIAGVVVLFGGFALPNIANAEGSYFDKLESLDLKNIRSEVRKRFDRNGSNSDSNSNSDSDEGMKVKIDRAGLRRMMNRYLPNS